MKVIYKFKWMIQLLRNHKKNEKYLFFIIKYYNKKNIKISYIFNDKIMIFFLILVNINKGVIIKEIGEKV
jgi:hypothetical protein